MKTAISLPDALFDSAEALASRLGVSRSQLYATAIARLLAEHEQVTERLNTVYGGTDGVPSAVDPDLRALQARALDPASDEGW